MKLETVEKLRNKGVITLVQCDESEKVSNKNIVKDTSDGKWYRIEETNEELRLELLARSFQCVSTMKNIMVGFTAVFVFYVLLIFLSAIG